MKSWGSCMCQCRSRDCSWTYNIGGSGHPHQSLSQAMFENPRSSRLCQAVADPRRLRLVLGLALLFVSTVFGACAHTPAASSQRSMSEAAPLQTGTFPSSWYAGGKDGTGRAQFQVHAYNDNFYILRQAAYTNYEKPFLYLLFGTERAILFDTGAGGVDVAAAVDGVINNWLRTNKRSSIPLIVAHTHAHGDHVAGDGQFANRAGITLVGKDTASVRAFFGIAEWPAGSGSYDLGNRVLDILPIPGHEASSIAIYDRQTQIMLTGDTFYPGRLYVRDGVAFSNSIQRLVDYSAQHPVVHFLGTHIEQSSTPFQDYEVGTIDQPDEHALQLTRTQLLELNDALKVMNGTVVRKLLPSLTVWPVTRR